MIRIAAADLRRIEAAAEAAYPEECCGLLVGRPAADGCTVVTRVVPARNVFSGATRNRFEVDPQVRIDLERALRGTDERLVGHYHSHPDHPARPSAHDLESAYEPELAWLITAVRGGRAKETAAYRADPAAGCFAVLTLAVEDAAG